MSDTITVTGVQSEADWNAFLDMPSRVYAGDPHWVQPLRSSVRKSLSPDAPFHRYGRFAAFIAHRPGETVPAGRIVAAVNDRLCEKENQAIGLFGFFECIDAADVAAALFSAAKDWLRGQGCSRCRGPIDLSTHVGGLTLIEGFDSPPYIMMPYNPRYYPDLIEGAGWEPAKDAIAYDFAMDQLSPAFGRAYRLSQSAGVTFRPIRIDKAGLEQDCRSLYRIFAESFTENWSSTPRDEDEFIEEAQDLKQIADPSLFPVAEHNGQMVGFWMGLPDFNHALRHANGRLSPWSILKILWYRRSITRARVLAMAVLPEYQKRRWAVGPALVYLGMKGGSDRPRPYERAELSWVWEDNNKSKALIEASGGVPYKRYRVYEADI